MSAKNSDKDSFYVGQKGKMDCSSACVATLLRLGMREKTQPRASLKGAEKLIREALRDRKGKAVRAWTDGEGLHPDLVDSILENEVGAKTRAEASLHYWTKPDPEAEDQSPCREPDAKDLRKHAFLVFTSCWVDDNGTFKNLGHYVVVHGVKRVSNTVNVKKDATKACDDMVQVVKVYCPATDAPYWTTWASLEKHGIQRVWQVPVAKND